MTPKDSVIRKPWFLLEEYRNHPPLFLYDFIRIRGEFLRKLTGVSPYSALLYRNGIAYTCFEYRSFLRMKRRLFRMAMRDPSFLETLYRNSDRSVQTWKRHAAAIGRLLKNKAANESVSGHYAILLRSINETTMTGQPMNMLVFDEDWLSRALQRYLRKHVNGEAAIRKLFSALTNPSANRRDAIFRRYQIDARHRRLFNLAFTAIRSKQRRYGILIRHNALITRIAQRIASTRRIPIERVLSSDENGICQSLASGLAPTSVIENEHPGVVFAGNRTIRLTMRQTSRLLGQLDRIPATNGELKGQTAVPGDVRGIVKVVRELKDIRKMNAGNILISNTTTADLLPAVKKAAAIVTDMGGITCHAAIVSRELGIPCIIGTKIATQVFKDGDLVEVNANHGWVRKVRT